MQSNKAKKPIESSVEGLDLEAFKSISPEDLEGLTWYEITTKLGLLSFNPHGSAPIEYMANSLPIIDSSAVLIVGCGTGGTAVRLAEISGAAICGIDISAESIKFANELAAKSPAKARLQFLEGDAHALPFPPDSFDFVITEYMAFFLKPGAFDGFFKVLKSGGRVVLSELMKDPRVLPSADAKILKAEEAYTELLGYAFHIPTVDEYLDRIRNAGFADVGVGKLFPMPSAAEKVKSGGGWKGVLAIAGPMLRLMVRSAELRKKFITMGFIKRTLYQSRSTAKYILQAVMTGEKHDE